MIDLANFLVGYLKRIIFFTDGGGPPAPLASIAPSAAPEKADINKTSGSFYATPWIGCKK